MLKIGSVIDGKYKILNIAGKGGMSVVYLAMNEKVNKQWAIKEIIKKEYRDFEVEKKEIEMMKGLKHPNLPTIVDVIERKDALLIVMDYIEGRSLEDIVQEQGPLDEKSVIRWAKQLCDVLHYLHTRTPPIIYRDMKPSNVMLKPDGNVVLIDFGAAREYKPQNLKDTVLLGTRGYAAPEQYRSDGQSDGRTDIYSLGITVFRLLTGENPESLCPIRKFRPDISVGIENIVIKCTKTLKQERYQSARELFEAFSRYWEQDEKFQKAQMKKLKIFFLPVLLSVVFGIGAAAFLLQEKTVRENNYQTFLTSAETCIEKEEALEFYRRAIKLNPEREEAYLLSLKNIFLEDGVLSEEESVQLRGLLNCCDEKGVFAEQYFRENEEGYALFSYEAGIVYFYKYEDKSNKKNARKYFETAASSEMLEEKKRKRAERLYVICDYYSRIGIMDEAGDVFVTYKDYWLDLITVSEGNLVETDNERTAIVMYEELLGQMITKTVEFQNAGVKKEELLRQIENIKAHLREDFNESEANVKKVLKNELRMLWGNVSRAEKIIESVYGKKG